MRGANGSRMEKRFTPWETDFTLETLLPLRNVTFTRTRVDYFPQIFISREREIPKNSAHFPGNPGKSRKKIFAQKLFIFRFYLNIYNFLLFVFAVEVLS